MPSTATITAFYSFSPNTKAKASEVNTNFGVFRGHIIAVDPNTATAATSQTYDIGSDERRWRAGYFRDIDLATSTSTATLVLKGDTTNTTGAFLFQFEGTTKAEINANGFNSQYIHFDYTSSTGTNTSTSYSAGATTGVTEVNIPNMTVTLSNVRNPIRIMLVSTTNSVGEFGSVLLSQTTSGAARINLYRDSTIIGVFVGPTGIQNTLHYPNDFNFIDFTPSTNPSYYIKAATASPTDSSNVTLERLKLIAIK